MAFSAAVVGKGARQLPVAPGWGRRAARNAGATSEAFARARVVSGADQLPKRPQFAVSMDMIPKRLSISSGDSLEHTHLIGPTGSGKSTAMLHLILADIAAGRSVLVLDPKTTS